LIYLIPLAGFGPRNTPESAQERSMTYATVMVGLSVDRPNDARLEVAAQLAERFGAAVIGITAVEFSPPLYLISGEQAQELFDRGRTAIKRRATELESEFRAAMLNRVAEVEWRCAEDFPSRYIVQQARACDIIVIGEAGPDAAAGPFVAINSSDLVMQAARPLLVVPDACNWLDLRRVLVACKDTVEVRRAVVDALPMLRKATEVTVLEIVEARADRAAALSRVKDVVIWLSRHGVNASELVPDLCGEASAQIDRIASELGAGVVVAGAYGHSRLREWVFGGVTRQLINSSRRCSLLSR
jgi:nucleotide-binding universal stress UspA family protein